MAIIKGKKNRPAPPQPEIAPSYLVGPMEEPEPEPAPPPEPVIPWTPETLAQGLVPERRMRPEEAERRQGYRREADRQLISKAHEEARMIHEVAREQGYAQGLAQGQAVIEQLGHSLEQLGQVEQQALERAIDRIIPIAVEIAEKIIKTEVTMDPSLIVAVAQDLIKRADAGQKQIIFRLNPVEVPVLQADIEAHPGWNFNGRQVLVLEDETVEIGGARLETPAGQIDATITTQLEVVRRLLGLGPVI